MMSSKNLKFIYCFLHVAFNVRRKDFELLHQCVFLPVPNGGVFTLSLEQLKLRQLLGAKLLIP